MGAIPSFLTAEFWQIYEHWENFHYLGQLPHGKGPLAENPLTVRVIKEFEKTLRMIQREVDERHAAQMKAEKRIRDLKKGK